MALAVDSTDRLLRQGQTHHEDRKEEDDGRLNNKKDRNREGARRGRDEKEAEMRGGSGAPKCLL